MTEDRPAFITRTQYAADAGARAARRREIGQQVKEKLGVNRKARRLAARLQRRDGCA